MNLRKSKTVLRVWFASQSDSYLTRFVDECRAGTIKYTDTCHCVRGLCEIGYLQANSPSAMSAERAFLKIARNTRDDDYSYIFHSERVGSDVVRRNRVLPVVLAEIRRRAKVQTPAPEFAKVGK